MSCGNRHECHSHAFVRLVTDLRDRFWEAQREKVAWGDEENHRRVCAGITGLVLPTAGDRISDGATFCGPIRSAVGRLKQSFLLPAQPYDIGVTWLLAGPSRNHALRRPASLLHDARTHYAAIPACEFSSIKTALAIGICTRR